MAKTRKFGGTLLTILIIAAIAGGAYYYWQRSTAKPPEISTTAVSRGSIIQAVTATGLLQAPTSVDVSSQISGQITQVLVDYNSPVKEGDVLARLDPATYKSKLAQAEAQLANTRANYTLTQLNTERTRELFKKALVSQQDLDQAEAQLQQAEAQLQIQQANVDNARVDLSRCTIYAPITGIVLDRLTDVGKTVAASLNAPTLFTLINDLTSMQISADVSEADIGSVALGQDVTFTVDAYPNRQFRGRVTQIRNLPKTSQSVVVYSTIIQVSNADLRLKPGMTANVSIITARRDDVLKISNTALRARVPEQLIPPSASNKTASSTTKPNDTNRQNGTNPNRDQIRALMQEAGVTFGQGQPPSPESLEKLRALAAERGIELPERFQAKARADGEAVTTTRTVYMIATPPPALSLNAITAKFGITDGTNTEVIDGLKEGDAVVTSIYIPGTTSTPANSNPFSGTRQMGGPR